MDWEPRWERILERHGDAVTRRRGEGKDYSRPFVVSLACHGKAQRRRVVNFVAIPLGGTIP